MTKEPQESGTDTGGKKFQVYKSAKAAMRMITEKGRRITFTSHQFITQDEDIIAYLDAEIKSGLRVVTKGDLVTSEDLDPMAALRRKHFAEFQKQQAKDAADAALGKSRDMGNTDPKVRIKPTSSKQVAS